MTLKSLAVVGAALLAISVAGCDRGDARHEPQAAINPHTEGATGTAVVPGSESTISGDRGTTRFEKKGAISPQ